MNFLYDLIFVTFCGNSATGALHPIVFIINGLARFFNDRLWLVNQGLISWVASRVEMTHLRTDAWEDDR